MFTADLDEAWAIFYGPEDCLYMDHTLYYYLKYMFVIGSIFILNVYFVNKWTGSALHMKSEMMTIKVFFVTIHNLKHLPML